MAYRNLKVSRAYRELLVAQRLVFDKDLGGRAAGLVETRKKFREQAHAQPEQMDELLQAAHDAADFLQHNVAQTERNEDGNYGEHSSLAR